MICCKQTVQGKDGGRKTHKKAITIIQVRNDSDLDKAVKVMSSS